MKIGSENYQNEVGDGATHTATNDSVKLNIDIVGIFSIEHRI